MNNASSKNSNCNTCSAELIVLVTIKVVIALLCLLRRHRAKRPSTHVERHRRAADALRLQAAQKLVGKVKPRRGRRHTTLLAQLSLGVGIKMGLQHLKIRRLKQATAGVFFGVDGLVVLSSSYRLSFATPRENPKPVAN